MALKPVIYKLRITLADTDRDYYDTVNLTIANHPSETVERMMARVLGYCLNVRENLVFTRGLSAVEEPDIWIRTPDERISLWIEVGEPTVDRIRKATRLSPLVRVYSFNSKSDTWWSQGQAKFSPLPAEFFQFPWGSIQALAALVKRTVDLSVTISGDTAYIASAMGECQVAWLPLGALPTAG